MEALDEFLTINMYIKSPLWMKKSIIEHGNNVGHFWDSFSKYIDSTYRYPQFYFNLLKFSALNIYHIKNRPKGPYVVLEFRPVFKFFSRSNCWNSIIITVDSRYCGSRIWGDAPESEFTFEKILGIFLIHNLEL